MEKFLRNKLNIILWVAAIVVAVVLTLYAIAATHFLIITVQEAYNRNLIKSGAMVTFNLTKVEQLKRR